MLTGSLMMWEQASVWWGAERVQRSPAGAALAPGGYMTFNPVKLIVSMIMLSAMGHVIIEPYSLALNCWEHLCWHTEVVFVPSHSSNAVATGETSIILSSILISCSSPVWLWFRLCQRTPQTISRYRKKQIVCRQRSVQGIAEEFRYRVLPYGSTQ